MTANQTELAQITEDLRNLSKLAILPANYNAATWNIRHMIARRNELLADIQAGQ